MNIYLHELRSYRKNTLIWMVTLCAVALFFFSMFPAFSKSADEIMAILNQMPKAVIAAFGFPFDLITTVLGFYSFLILCVSICGAVQGMYLGVSVIAKETTGKTADFLLTKPVTRPKVITAKILATLTCVTATSIVYGFAAFATAMALNTQDFAVMPFVLMTLSVYFIQIIFLAIGILTATLIPKIKSVLPVSLSTVFSFFVIGMIGAVLNEQTIYYLSPFKYFDSLYIIRNSAYQMQYLLAGLLIVAVSVGLTYFYYSKRDIHAV
jgi:ABC-2 type transport system permease protein